MQLDCSTKRLGQTGELVSECGRMCLLGSKESNDPEGVAHVSQGRSPWNSGREERDEAGLCELRRQSHLALNGLDVG